MEKVDRIIANPHHNHNLMHIIPDNDNKNSFFLVLPDVRNLPESELLEPEEGKISITYGSYATRDHQISADFSKNHVLTICMTVADEFIELVNVPGDDTEDWKRLECVRFTFFKSDKTEIFTYSSLSSKLKDDQVQSTIAHKVKFIRCFTAKYNRMKWNDDIRIAKVQLVAARRVAEASKNSHLDFSPWLESEQFSDVVFKCMDTKIYAHKIVLSVHSTGLYNICSNNTRCIDEGVIDMKDTSPDAVKCLMKYMYTGVLDMEVGLIQDVTALAMEYDMQELLKLSSKRMIEEINLKNVLDIFKFTNNKPYLEPVAAEAKKYILLRKRMLFGEGKNSIAVLLDLPDILSHFFVSHAYF